MSGDFYAIDQSKIKASLVDLLFALKLALTADGLRLLTDFALRRLFIVAAQFHFTENPFALHLFFERTQCLIDVVVAYIYTYDFDHPFLICFDVVVCFLFYVNNGA